MEIIRKEKDLKRSFENPVLTIGNFDGVHLGHQHIFRLVKEKAREIGGESIVYTFDPHPVEVLAPEHKPLLITPLEEKLRLIEEQGMDVAILANFSAKFASQTPEDFVKEFSMIRSGSASFMSGTTILSGRTAGGISLC